MKDQETQIKFVQLRVQGLSYARISRELDVATGTLVNWSRRFRFEIQNFRAIEMEALREQLVESQEGRARLLASQLKRVDEEIAKRDVAELSTGSLFHLARSLRRQILDETAGGAFASPVDQIPSEEYHEKAQEWNP